MLQVGQWLMPSLLPDSICSNPFMSPAAAEDWQFVPVLWKCQCSCIELWNLKLSRMAVIDPLLTQVRDFLSHWISHVILDAFHFNRYIQLPPCPHLRNAAEQTGDHGGSRPDAIGGAACFGTMYFFTWLIASLLGIRRSKSSSYCLGMCKSQQWQHIEMEK